MILICFAHSFVFMRCVVTAKVKIPTDQRVVSTLNLYQKGLQLCVDVAWERKIKNNVKLHSFVYKRLRLLGLPAQLAVACIKQACGFVKKAKSRPVIRRASIQYNVPRAASFKAGVLSVSTITGRVKLPFIVPKCYE